MSGDDVLAHSNTCAGRSSAVLGTSAEPGPTTDAMRAGQRSTVPASAPALTRAATTLEIWSPYNGDSSSAICQSEAEALFLAILPAAAALPRSARVARRWLECAAFLAVVVFFLAPEIHDAVDPTTLLVTTPTVWAFLHRLVGIALGIVIAIAIASPEGTSPQAAGADALPVANS